jgi:hypothetical protein
MSDNKYRSVEHAARLVAESNGRISDNRGGAFRRTSTSNPVFWRDNHGVDVGAQRNDAHHKAAVTGDTESKRDKEQMINKRTREDEKRDRDMKRLLKSLKEELTPEQKKEVSTWQRDPEAHAKTDHFFGRGNDEKIEELQGGSNKSEPHKAVEAHLGQEISHDDYKAGHTTDKYGRKVKIGALLQKTKAHPNLINQFANDSTRQLKRENRLSVQVTRSAHGVAGQTSGGQSWENESCKNFENGSNSHYLKPEVKHGTVVAYLRNHHGHELARATFHPHHDEEGNVVYVPNSYYGPRVKEFEDHIKGLAGRLSHPDAPKDGVYSIHPEVYNDKTSNTSLHPDTTTSRLHDILQTGSKLAKKTALAHHNITAEHIHNALDDRDEGVRIAAAQHPNANTHNLSKALRDVNSEVRAIAVGHPNATSEHLHKALNDKDSSVRQSAVKNSNASSEHLHKALDDKDDYVRAAAVNHANATSEHLKRALKDKNPSIRNIAKARLKQLKESTDLEERYRKTYKHIPSVFLRLRKKPIKETEEMNEARKELDEAIKGWKHAGRDLMKMRTARSDAAKSARLVTVKKDGTESKMHDAISYHNDEDSARKHHDNITKLNPTRKIRHNLYVDGKKIEMLGEETLDEAKKFVFDKPMSSTVKAYSNRDTNELKDMHARWSKDHSNPKNDPITSEKLLAVHHVLKSRGESVELPKHKNLGMHVYEETNTEKRMQIKNVARPNDPAPTSKNSTLGKQGSIEKRVMENYGLSKDLVDITRQILERKTEDEPNNTKGDTNLKKDLGVTAKDHKSAYSKMRDEMGMKDREVTRRLVGEDNSKIIINPDLNTKTDDGNSVKKESKHTTPKTDKERKLAALAHPKDKITGVFAKEETELSEVRGTFTDLPSPGRQTDARNFGFHPSFSDKKNKEAIDAAKRALGARGGKVVGVPDSHKHLMGEAVEFSDAELEHINAILGEGELNELKRSTLGSYINKATNDIDDRSYSLGADHGTYDTKDKFAKKADDAAERKIASRKAFIGKAVDRLTKEELELDEAEELHPDYKLVNTGKKSTTAHPDGKPVYELHHKGKHLSTITPYSSYRDRKRPGSRIVSSRTDITKYGATHEKPFADTLSSRMNMMSLGFTGTSAKEVAHDIIRHHQSTIKEELEHINNILKEGRYAIVHTKSRKILSTHNNERDANDEHSGLSNKDEYQVKKTGIKPRDWSVKEDLELDEARGRPPKSGKEAEGDDTHKHPIQQLTKIAYAIQGNEPSFEHKDGSKTKITKQLARHITTAYNAMRTSQEKDDFANKLHANRDSMMAAVRTHI